MEEKVAFGKLISAYRVYNSKQETASMDVARSGGTGSGQAEGISVEYGRGGEAWRGAWS